ncbi:hypothetical protein GM661_01225 [Iocasia frigidifontis]|uniref:Uncharacterized protein n=1 Tax=Iocasia fonsfrigidae TaxID=2682810 RepID=A0A8A7KBH7_9FIRM|nr:hypothetical protein [Iocasia fonsfrigidae]QTL96689.1 hypothetical protein GM661_01225 [Iocasia fonsfrigidae]
MEKFYYGSRCNFNLFYEELLEDFTKQYIEAQAGPRANFGWQGREPTLRGLEFFQKAVELQKNIYRK